MKITAAVLFLFRLGCYNILDHSGCFCGISLSHFKSNVLQWKLANVSLTGKRKFIHTYIHSHLVLAFWITALKWTFLIITVIVISGATDPKLNEVTEHLDPRLNLTVGNWKQDVLHWYGGHKFQFWMLTTQLWKYIRESEKGWIRCFKAKYTPICFPRIPTKYKATTINHVM